GAYFDGFDVPCVPRRDDC
uniref:Conotoxin AusB n=1 Tax=Conus australis TaxID=1519798 RepID=CONGA_CONAV|nr:RecName: Full=Conotoxin AusB [Conus australis]